MSQYLVEMPDGWKPQVCGLCSMKYACHANYSIKTACVDRCPLSSAKPVRPVNGWGEISHAGQLYTVEETKEEKGNGEN